MFIVGGDYDKLYFKNFQYSDIIIRMEGFEVSLSLFSLPLLVGFGWPL